MVLAWVDVFKYYIGVPKLLVVFLPKKVQILICLEVPEFQLTVKPFASQVESGLQCLPHLVKFQKADHLHGDVHLQKIIVAETPRNLISPVAPWKLYHVACVSNIGFVPFVATIWLVVAP